MKLRSFTKSGTKFFKSSLGKITLVCVSVILLFIFFPSCGKQGKEIVYVVEAHPLRDGHVRAVNTNQYEAKKASKITDVSVKVDGIEESNNGTMAVSFNFEDSSGTEEFTLNGVIKSGIAELTEGGEEKVVGYGTCLSANCGQVVVDLYYLDDQNKLQTTQSETYTVASNRPMAYLDDSDPDPEGGRQAEYATQTNLNTVADKLDLNQSQVNDFIADQPVIASQEFVTFWQEYLDKLKQEQGVNTSPAIPRESVEVVVDGGQGLLFKLTDRNSNTFARPFNSRIEQRISVGEEQEVGVQGILLNGEPLVNDRRNCVRWADESRQKGQFRYAASLLNAVLLYTGKQFKRRLRGCEVNIVVNKSSNEDGGTLRFLSDPNRSHKTHQNGLDVDISYVNRQRPFADVVNNGNVTLNQRNSIKNLKLIKEFYDTGTVNRFIMSPYIKAHLVKIARQENLLSEYQEALEKIFPYQNHEDHIHLELVCATFGVSSNSGCRETDAKHYKWPIANCNDNTCSRQQIPVVHRSPDPVVAQLEPDTSSNRTRTTESSGSSEANQPDTPSRTNDQTASTDTSGNDSTTDVGTSTPNRTGRRNRSGRVTAPANNKPTSSAQKVARCTAIQKRAIRDDGVHDPEGCIPTNSSQEKLDEFGKNLQPGVTLCRWNKFYILPNLCKVRTSLVKNGRLKDWLFYECTKRQVRNIGYPPPADICSHSSSYNIERFIYNEMDDEDANLCMWSMHICKIER